ncbi:hypothetical protein [Streptomyces sp. KR80]|uniref:hypothetical protein n=1 Tax=Streptomyces sp. KR80 TaxID=3457426 RepID=UPI003FD346E9
MVTRRRRYAGIAHFPEALSVGSDALGLTEEVKIGQHKVRLTLPVFDPDSEKLAGPPDERLLPDSVESAFSDAWGYQSGGDLYRVGAARSSILLVPASNMATSDELRRLGESFFRWFDIVFHWATAWSGELVRQVGPKHSSAFNVITDGANIVGSGVSLGGVYLVGVPLTRDQVVGAFRRASRGEHLPPEHRLLLDAQAARMDGDFRRAVIDSATAAEVAIASAISDHLRSKKLTDAFIENLIKRAGGIIGLVDLYVGLGHALGVSKNKLMPELSEVRNNAAHRGWIPTDDIAKTAHRHARTVVGSAKPLPAS